MPSGTDPSSSSFYTSYTTEPGTRINWRKFEIMGDVIVSLQRAQEAQYGSLGSFRGNEQLRELVLDAKLVRDEEVGDVKRSQQTVFFDADSDSHRIYTIEVYSASLWQRQQIGPRAPLPQASFANCLKDACSDGMLCCRISLGETHHQEHDVTIIQNLCMSLAGTAMTN
jgi:hypothetical protein